MRSQWERLLAQLPATSRCVLTYHDLAFDLAGRPDPARREFMRRLLTGLSQPRGTLSFWPLGLVQADADSDRIHVSVNYFLAGLSKLQPEVVFIFGSRCSLVLGLEHPDYDCVTVDIFGQGPRRYCFLPELQEFIDNPASVATLTSFILAMLAS